jgi:hypothetical protein
MDPKLNLDEGTYLSQGGEIKTFSLFSRYTVAANTTRTQMFASKLGDSGFTRLDQTNMILGGQMTNADKLVIKGFALRYNGGAAKSDANFIAAMSWLSTTAIEFIIGQKSPMFQNRIADMMGLALNLFSDPTTAAEPVSYTVISQARNFFRLERPITLASGTPFHVDVVPGVAATAQQVTDGDIFDFGLVGDYWSRV